jgi:hypothetical protein
VLREQCGELDRSRQGQVTPRTWSRVSKQLALVDSNHHQRIQRAPSVESSRTIQCQSAAQRTTYGLALASFRAIQNGENHGV